MVSLSNNGLSDECMKKRPSENGYHTLHFGVTPKHKVRKVWAVRDFPSGCCRNAPKIDLSHKENAVVTISENMADKLVAHGGNGPNNGIEFCSVEVVDCLSNIQENEELDKLAENALAKTTSVVENRVEEPTSHARSLGFELSKDIESSEMSLLKKAKVIQCDELVKEVDGERSSILVKNVVSMTDGAIPVCDVKTFSPPQWPVKNGNAADNSSSLPKNKYCQRRVFAVRDFPPFCGRNAPMPTEQDRLGGNEASKRVVVLDKEVTENESIETSKNVMGTGTSHMKLTASQEADSLSKIEVTGSKCSLMERTTVCIENPEGVHDSYIGRSQLERTIILPETVMKKENDDAGKIVGKENIVYSQNECEKATTARHALGSVNENIRPIVHDLMAEPYCPWKQMNQTSLDGVTRRNQVQKPNMHRQKKSLAVARKSIPKTKFSRRQFGRTKSGFIGEAAEGYSNALVASNGRACGLNREALPEESPIGRGHREFNVNLPPFGSSSNDARSKVRETLRLFQSICRKILRGEESNGEVKPKQKDKKNRRIDIQASNFIKEKGKEVNTGPRILGEVPGVEVGDAFQYRVELALVGVHRLYQAGIDFLNNGGMLVATSIVASGGYDDDLGDADELIYSGQGGNLTGKDKTPEDQKLVKGNLALKNSIATRNPVRVIRGSKAESTDGRANLVTTYVYDGLYTVQNYWAERGSHGKLVFMFKLVRIPGQAALTWREVKSSRKSKVRHGVCVPDITEGKESLPITAVNTIDGEKPPPFNYIKKMIYPDGFHPAPPKGCDCIGRCSDAKRCSCAVKNGGEIPYNRNGAIVEVKPLVYECGPLCKCPPSCYNRVSQHGIKIPLEIFKTDTRGWGVRAVTSISSGTFICEYVGEILEDREAEQRIGSDEYLFDIGKNYSDCTANSSGQADLNELADEGGFTIDAAHYGNIGRFINHSCSPNLYAQNVVYDHEDKKMPHIMLFAADNIPPLKELSYHYNYAVDQVYDSDGKIKVKRCFCGSSDCTGRMY
ncbi:histone-lysine N-methyltransferase, H3 lysine-9 specific SUVH6-like [Nicotiana sylvestris]|uniref:Histone-lysine N-methyltransferase, H3 lysine-9 specific SUVH5-like n=1 Tax=Nicotiana sylvestris TaxID=4096 RepID=A0A1U7Y9I9_NICSY|nr:PREDICTED: histone-lysine N-methyltransferase, H3 lysine-9 specific SUVH5-like [Nicotiana sylvestris]XP_009798601.1 PREDICTED: histone-lysine N-methyltransferase, H3 lysine-9 specific SUVH5-like [Nicotiana sylvestris]